MGVAHNYSLPFFIYFQQSGKREIIMASTQQDAWEAKCETGSGL